MCKSPSETVLVVFLADVVIDQPVSSIHLENCVILHIEDDDAAAYIFRLALDEAGLKVSVYRISDGEQALLFLRKQGIYARAGTPQLVLLDLNLPRVSGWDVLAARQSDPALQAIPFIVMSTGSSNQHAAKALAQGAQHYIEKLGNIDELVRQVQTSCQRYIPSQKA